VLNNGAHSEVEVEVLTCGEQPPATPLAGVAQQQHADASPRGGGGDEAVVRRAERSLQPSKLIGWSPTPLPLSLRRVNRLIRP
jgi:hypothetical protein